VKLEFVDGEWVASCESDRHMPYEWRPAGQSQSQVQSGLSTHFGLGEELGIYDALLGCIHGGFAEYGVIEYRYSQDNPDDYATLVERYGHRALAPTQYSASVYLSRQLGQMWRDGRIAGRWAPATGYWAYNGQIGAYGPAGTPESAGCLSWAEFATSTLGVDPGDWPPLGYRAADH